MSMLERVKSLLLGRGIPEEARKALEEAKSLTELRDKLDQSAHEKLVDGFIHGLEPDLTQEGQ